jgi:hypothetical protein
MAVLPWDQWVELVNVDRMLGVKAATFLLSGAANAKEVEKD